MIKDYFKKNQSRLLILLPVTIIISTALSLILFVNWMHSVHSGIKHNVATEILQKKVEQALEKKADRLFTFLRLAKEYKPNLDDDTWLMEHLENAYISHKNTDIACIFRVNKEQNGFFTLFSTQEKIVAGQVLPQKNILKLNAQTLKNMSSHESYHFLHKLNDTDYVHVLLKKYPKSDLLISVSMSDVSYKNLYNTYIQKYTEATEEKRMFVLVVILAVGALASLIIARIVKYVNQNFLRSQAELKEKNQLLKEQLYIDQASGLFNDRKLHEEIEKAQYPRLILIEIDHFKDLLEYRGFQESELVVSQVKEKLQKFCKTYNEYGMTLFRVTNKQFALLEDALFDVERYEALALELAAMFKNSRITNLKNSDVINYTCTIGFSLEEKHTFETANISLRRAKNDGKDYLCYFKSLDDYHHYQEQVKSAEYIKTALERDKVVPFYQPIFNREKEISKYECLVRIINEEQEIIAPRIFLETSRKIKRYADIEKSLIKKSFQAAKESGKIVSINLSLRDMTDSDVSNFILEELLEYGIAEQVVFEMLEEDNIQLIKRVESFIKRLKSMGAKIAIDDFGSGYSNFSYILALKPDFLKIDGSLIKNIHNDAKSYALVSAILAFAKQLGIKTTAEFIHNEEVFNTCMELGVDEFQGFYLAEPGPSII